MCPVSCGEGALRKRSVMCVSTSKGEDEPELALPDQDCDSELRPEEVEPCPDLPLCEVSSSSEAPFIVYAAEDKSAAFYNITGGVGGLGGSGSGSSSESSTEIEPPEILEFDNVVEVDGAPEDGSMYNAKPKWQVSKWSHCLGGRRTRKVSCSVPSATGEESGCKLESRPSDSEECFAGKWATGERP